MHFLIQSAFGRAVAATGCAVVGLAVTTSCSSPTKAERTTTPAYREGTPGGTLVETYRLVVTVGAVNPVTRKLTLVASDGSQNTFTAGAGDETLEKLRIGDQVRGTVTRVLVVLLDKDNAALEEGPILPAVVSSEDARSGVLRSDTVQRTARVGAVDRKRRQATLELADGTSKTFPICKEVDPRQVKKGREVVIRTSSSVVLGLENP
jgi:hypothetical protein